MFKIKAVLIGLPRCFENESKALHSLSASI